MHLNVILSENEFKFYTTSLAQRFWGIFFNPSPSSLSVTAELSRNKTSQSLTHDTTKFWNRNDTKFYPLVGVRLFQEMGSAQSTILFLCSECFWISHGFHHFTFKEPYAISLHAELQAVRTCQSELLSFSESLSGGEQKKILLRNNILCFSV